MCAVPTELIFDVVDTDGDTLMNIEEFRTFVHAVTNVKSIIEQWKSIASELSPAELASLPQNTTLMARKTVIMTVWSLLTTTSQSVQRKGSLND